MVSQESYSLPLAMKSQVAKYWYIYAILFAVVIYMIMRYLKRVREVQEAEDAVPDWNPADGMGEARNLGGYYYPGTPGSPNGAGQPMNLQSTGSLNSPYYVNRSDGQRWDSQFSNGPYSPYDVAPQGQDSNTPYNAVQNEQKPDSKYTGNPYAADPAGRDYPDPGMGAYTPEVKDSTYISSESKGEEY